MIECPKCKTKDYMSWDSDVAFSDIGIDGNGVISFYECLKCGTTVEIRIPEETESANRSNRCRRS